MPPPSAPHRPLKLAAPENTVLDYGIQTSPIPSTTQNECRFHFEIDAIVQGIVAACVSLPLLYSMTSHVVPMGIGIGLGALGVLVMQQMGTPSSVAMSVATKRELSFPQPSPLPKRPKHTPPSRLPVMQNILSALTHLKCCPICWSSGLGGVPRPCSTHEHLDGLQIPGGSLGVCRQCHVTTKLCTDSEGCQWAGIVAPVAVHAWSVPEVRERLMGVLGLPAKMTQLEYRRWLGKELTEGEWPTGAMAVFDAILRIKEETAFGFGEL